MRTFNTTTPIHYDVLYSNESENSVDFRSKLTNDLLSVVNSVKYSYFSVDNSIIGVVDLLTNNYLKRMFHKYYETLGKNFDGVVCLSSQEPSSYLEVDKKLFYKTTIKKVNKLGRFVYFGIIFELLKVFTSVGYYVILKQYNSYESKYYLYYKFFKKDILQIRFMNKYSDELIEQLKKSLVHSFILLFDDGSELRFELNCDTDSLKIKSCSENGISCIIKNIITELVCLDKKCIYVRKLLKETLDQFLVNKL